MYEERATKASNLLRKLTKKKTKGGKVDSIMGNIMQTPTLDSPRKFSVLSATN